MVKARRATRRASRSLTVVTPKTSPSRRTLQGRLQHRVRSSRLRTNPRHKPANPSRPRLSKTKPRRRWGPPIPRRKTPPCRGTPGLRLLRRWGVPISPPCRAWTKPRLPMAKPVCPSSWRPPSPTLTKSNLQENRPPVRRRTQSVLPICCRMIREALAMQANLPTACPWPPRTGPQTPPTLPALRRQTMRTILKAQADLRVFHPRPPLIVPPTQSDLPRPQSLRRVPKRSVRHRRIVRWSQPSNRPTQPNLPAASPRRTPVQVLRTTPGLTLQQTPAIGRPP